MGNKQSGRGGLPREKRGQLERLIRAQADGEGWTNVEIARAVGCDVSTVSREKRRMRLRIHDAAGSGKTAEADLPSQVRCGGCGGVILAAETQCRRCLHRATIPMRGPRFKLPRRSQKARWAA